LRSADPVALAPASALPVQRPIGVASTKRSMSVSGPRATPSISSRGRLPSSPIRPWIPLQSTLPSCAFAPLMSIVERSTTSPPDPPVSGGQVSCAVPRAPGRAAPSSGM
jgi:hypothetical protein